MIITILLCIVTAAITAAVTYQITDRKAFADGVAEGRHQVRAELQAAAVDELLVAGEEDLPPPINAQLRELVSRRVLSKAEQKLAERRAYPITI